MIIIVLVSISPKSIRSGMVATLRDGSSCSRTLKVVIYLVLEEKKQAAAANA